MRSAALLLALALVACGGRAEPAPLAGTSWQLVELRGGGPVQRVDDPARYTMAFDAADEVALRLDCNRGRGRSAVTSTGPRDGRIAFGPIAATRAMCPPGSLDTRLGQALTGTLTYTLEGDALTLNAPGGAQLVWRRAAD